MRGLELAYKYYNELFEESFRRDFPKIAEVAAVGLVGNGSECYGYDDELSHDHDWGAGLFIWLPDSMRDKIPVLNSWQQDLLAQHPEYPARQKSAYGASIGAFAISDFYTMLIGFPRGPQTLDEWRVIPENLLSLAVNGAVFADPEGEFTAVRRHLEEYYPEDLRKKRLAARCMALAQVGQYNLPRIIWRMDPVSERMVAARFCSEAIQMIFLLEKSFKPYYKWEFRALAELSPFGSQMKNKLSNFLLLSEGGARIEPAEEICNDLLEELHRQGLCRTNETFLTIAGQEIQDSIEDARLGSLPPQADV